MSEVYCLGCGTKKISKKNSLTDRVVCCKCKKCFWCGKTIPVHTYYNRVERKNAHTYECDIKHRISRQHIRQMKQIKPVIRGI